jgi:hypothetical protein
MTIAADGSRFTTTDEALVPDPPRLHRGSIFSLILAALSAFSLITLPWLVAALSAVVLAVASLWTIHRSQGRLYGRGYASVALCLSLFLISLGVSHRVYHERLMLRRSEQIAQQWIDLLRAGKVEIVHQLTLLKPYRVSDSGPLEDYYAHPDHASTFKHFQSQTEIKALRGITDATIDLQSSRQSQLSTNSEQYTHRYRVTFPQDSNARLDLTIVTERSRDFHGPWRWRILSSSGAWHKTQ